MSKRLLDVGIAVCALLLVAPLLLILALLIRFDSRGPIFFRQLRVGQGGRHFRIVKLRTMVVDAEKLGPHVTAGKDPRVTRAGRWLRAHKLDELPQLWNVLRGDMSLVGPRPEVPAYVELYPEAFRSLVLSVKPGLTDPASLAFFDEQQILGSQPDPERAYREVVLPQKLALYAEYVRNRTLRGDLALIGATIGRVLGIGH